MRLPLALVATASFLTGWLAPAAQMRPLDLKTALSMKTFGDRTPLSLSSDGSLVAFTAIDPLRRSSGGGSLTNSGVSSEYEGGDVWLADLRTGKNRNLTQGVGSSWDPVWSPDGKKLAFYSDRNGKARVWVWDRASDRLHIMAPDIVRVFFGFEILRWTPDSKAIVAKVLPGDLTLEEAVRSASDYVPPKTSPPPANQPDVMVFSSKQAPVQTNGTAGFLNINRCDLVLIDAGSSAVRRLVTNLRIRGVWLSPRGDFAAITVYKGFTPSLRFDVELLPLAGGDPRLVATDVGMEYGTNLSWSPRGDSFAYIAKGEVYLVNAANATVSKLVNESHPAFNHSYRPPVWSDDGTLLYLLGGSQLFRTTVGSGRTEPLATFPRDVWFDEILGPEAGRSAGTGQSNHLLLSARDYSKIEAGFYDVDAVSGALMRLLMEPKRHGSPDDVLYTTTTSRDGRTTIYVSEDGSHPPDLWRVDWPQAKPQQLSHLNPQFDDISAGESRLIDYRDSEGKPLRAALLLPSNYRPGERYPLVTWVYGGVDGSAAVRRFGLGGEGIDNMHFFATRGYAVLYPDTPLRTGRPANDLVNTVSPAVQAVIDLGIAKPGRVGVMGQSYGGYSVLALISRTSLFQAAVARAAQANLISHYLNFRDATGDSVGIRWAETGQGHMGGSLWETRDAFIENSPIFEMDHVNTPLLLIHGKMDSTVAPYLADEVFVALRRLGKDVTYLKYQREEHSEVTWSFPDVQDELSRILEFLDLHLKVSGQ